MNTITGYKLAKNVNAILRAKGLKEIPPQMVYNYISKNLIPSTIVEGQRVVEEDKANEWVQKYVTKKEGR